ALPLHASEAEASPDAAASGAERSPTELAAVRVQAGKPKADTSRVNAFGGGSWKDTPASVNVLERDYLDRRQVRSLSELASNDASLGDAYAPVGYY
ncbi:Plug domain-containing protein, partial [Escherichia coli]|uniref:Plug domain-containing protein n=2 Tax=Gammaproteobacteria TaxID=1236 RepID=UPI00200E9A3C